MTTSPKPAFAEPTLAELIRYNNWANQALIDTCQTLDPSELEAAMPGAYGTIRDTIQHIIEGEEFYISLLTGHRPRPPFGWATKPGLPELKDYAVQVGNALAEAVNQTRPTDPITEVDGGNTFHYQAVVVLIQIISHGVEHRTNITTTINAKDHTPPALDGWGYLSSDLKRFSIREKVNE